MAETKNEEPTHDLVEHFFRHEYASLVSVLTRGFGVARIDLVEDMVGAALVEAMNSWKQTGVPENPGAWIHRVARNRLLDALRREKVHAKALAFAAAMASDTVSPSAIVERWLDERELPDNLLRMMFVCCHPALDRKSQVALSLKVLCGFSVNEVARGLLLKPEAAKKRIQRAKAELAALRVSVEFPPAKELPTRLAAVHEVLYLMFNEGYSTSHGVEPIRDDICEEAARLCHLLCEHAALSTPESRALLALMLFHASRLDARTDEQGNVVLLEDQDRTRWDQKLITAAHGWLVKSAQRVPSRYHLEAAVAQMHCSVGSLAETDWQKVVMCYDRLLEMSPSPVYRLNRAIAVGQGGDTQQALTELQVIGEAAELEDYYLLDCAKGYLLQLAGDTKAATDAYLAALARTIPEHQKSLVKRRLLELNS